MAAWSKIRNWNGSRRRAALAGLFLSAPLCLDLTSGLYMAADGYIPDSFLFYAVLCYNLLYYVVLAVLLFRGLFGNWRRTATMLCATVIAPLLTWYTLPMFWSAGFFCYIYPEKTYLKDHCHPISFLQDKRTFYLGFCDVDSLGDGQVMFSYVYDTSGDIENDQGSKDRNHTKDRLEFVNAVRAFFYDDPNESFEVANFGTEHLYGCFYKVGFDSADADGFTSEYGKPPFNSKNRFIPLF